MGKPKARSSPRRPKFRDGTNVVDPYGHLAGVGPFDVLIVTHTNDDGTVEVARLGGSEQFHRVDPRHLIHPE
jgi:hypothetical protein